MDSQKLWKILLACFFISSAFCGSAQIKDIGLPFVHNFSRKDYNAASQNWSIGQDEKGIMYFGNNAGLLSYNGKDWTVNALPNNSIVRSVVCHEKRIYVGAYNELGFYEYDNYGQLHYHSLMGQLPNGVKSFDEVWRIFLTDQGIVFQSYYYLFVYHNESFKVIEPKSKFGFSYQVNEAIYIVDRGFGLYEFSNGELSPMLLKDEFFQKHEISFILPDDDDNLLLGTTNHGIYLLKGEQILPWEMPINETLKKNQIFTGVSLGKGQIAVGTIQDGIYILDLSGNIIMHLNRARKLQNNTVLSIFRDKSENLWLGQDNGIAMLEVNSPFSIFDYSYNIESSYASHVHNNHLYIGTNQGLFTKPMKELPNRYLLNNGFSKVKGTLGQVWHLEERKGELFCGQNFGAFLIDQGRSSALSNILGAWDFEPIPWDSRYLIGGHYTGLNLFYKANASSSWKHLGVLPGFDESSKELMFDHLGNLWITHAIKGLFKMRFNQETQQITQVESIKEDKGLPGLPYRLCKLDGKTLILAQSAFYEFVSDRKGFVLNETYSQFFTEIPHLLDVKQDEQGDVWFFAEEKMGVFRLQEDGSYNLIEKPFLRIKNHFMKGSFENVQSISDRTYLIGSQDGMLHYDSGKLKSFDFTYSTHFKQVEIQKRKRSEEDSIQTQRMNLKMGNTDLAYKFNTIRFDFFTAYFEGDGDLQHAYRLVGFNDKWTNWENTTSKEYSNLPEGDYVFEVKAMNVFEIESQLAHYRFTIKPPFYRSRLAYFIYFLSIFMLIFLNLIYYRKKIERTRRIEADKMVSKQHELKQEVIQSGVRIEKLQEEKMASEMRLKNIELANSTMNLVQKNKLLTRVKKDLLVVSDKAKSNAVKVDIADLVKRIDKDISNDKNLKLFDEYFDRVHQDFLKSIKEKHPSLTPKDMRLCAYLKMNISTKEIAPLMNVSIRGLEISRYRLRKKLELEREVNLVDYIMSI